MLSCTCLPFVASLSAAVTRTKMVQFVDFHYVLKGLHGVVSACNSFLLISPVPNASCPKRMGTRTKAFFCETVLDLLLGLIHLLPAFEWHWIQCR